MKEEYEFDCDEILDEFRSGKKLTGKSEPLNSIKGTSDGIQY